MKYFDVKSADEEIVFPLVVLFGCQQGDVAWG